MSVMEYAAKFNELRRFNPDIMNDDEKKVDKFKSAPLVLTIYKDILGRAHKLERYIRQTKRKREF